MKKGVISLLVASWFLAACADNSVQQTQKSSNKTPIVSTQQPIFPVSMGNLAKSEEERFALFIDYLKQRALEEGIQTDTVDSAFTNVTLLKRVISSDKNQLEKKVLLDDYLTRVLTPTKKRMAGEKYLEEQALLERTAKQYGVPANYIVALWGMESNFGRLQGRENIISAMASLAFEGRREVFFTKQLMYALQIVDGGHRSVENLKGSWAGAMGQCQFMPSSFISYGADGDGDGVIDIWSNRADVFASIANYLKTEGWQSKEGWGHEATLPAKFDRDLIGLESDKGRTVKEWQKLGVTVPTLTKGEAATMAWIIEPDDGLDRAFIVYQNFKTIMHWNRSFYFALSIGMLADTIPTR